VPEPSEYLADTDAVAAVVAHLANHERVTAALGGEGRVRATNEPPYPRLRVTPATGSDRDLLWLVAPAVQIEALGDLDGTITPTDLRRILYIALGACKEMPDRLYGYGEPVVTDIRSGGAGGRADLPTGQYRWLSTIQVFIHPPIPAPTP
jgi:hypothetical protein